MQKNLLSKRYRNLWVQLKIGRWWKELRGEIQMFVTQWYVFFPGYSNEFCLRNVKLLGKAFKWIIFSNFRLGTILHEETKIEPADQTLTGVDGFDISQFFDEMRRVMGSFIRNPFNAMHN